MVRLTDFWLCGALPGGGDASYNQKALQYIIEGWWQPGRVGGMGATSLICTHNRYTSVAFSGRRHMEGPITSGFSISPPIQ